MHNTQQEHALPSIGRAMQSAIFLTATFLVGGFFVLSAVSAHAASQTDVIINEFVSATSSGNEWVELLNTTGTDVSLDGWKLTELTTPDAIPAEVDWAALSGTIPAYGILVFEVTGTNFNNPGDSIGLYDNSATLMQRVTYGAVNGYISEAGLETEPSSVQSGSFDGTNWSISGTPTKGWFNDAGQDGAAPLLSAIDSSLSSSGITSNIGELDNPSATPTAESDALYFEKSGKGKIVFTDSLNLSDQATVSVLQSLGTAMDMSDGHISFNSTTAAAMSATGATVYMYGLDDLGFIAQPNIIVKNDAGTVIDGTNIVSIVSYAPGGENSGELSFTAAHFTQFDVDYPVTNGTTGVKYATIQSAIDAASSGDTINVAAGTYVEDLEIDKTLELAGADKATTVIKGLDTESDANWPLANPNIDLQADNASIHGFTIQSPDVADAYYSSGLVLNGQYNEIYDNNFVSIATGSGYNVVMQTYRDDVLGFNSDISSLSIHDNTFSGTPGGGYVGIFINHTLTGTGTVSIADNSFSGNIVQGIFTERSNVEVSGNTLVSSVSSSSYGILIEDFDARAQDTVSVTDNSVSGFAVGILVGRTSPSAQDLSDVAITSNTIQGNDKGIMVRSSADGVLINSNSINGNTTYGLENTDSAELSATNNFWGAASGPAGEGLGHGDSISENVSYRPWLLEEDGDTYDLTIALTEAGEWTLVSAPQLLSEAPAIIDDEAAVVAMLGYESGEFTTPTDSEKPVSAFYVQTTNMGGIGFTYATATSLTQTSKDLAIGWNLIGTNSVGTAIDEFSSIQNTGTDAGMITLHVPDTQNERKDYGNTVWSTDGDRDLNANPITELPVKNVSIYDGYWVFMNVAKTFAKQITI